LRSSAINPVPAGSGQARGGDRLSARPGFILQQRPRRAL